MKTGLERIAVKAQQDSNLQFTSLAHHITKELIWDSLHHMPKNACPVLMCHKRYGCNRL
ncbi:hypothetical protein ACDX78_11895 [Virgibacillus oceani]